MSALQRIADLSQTSHQVRKMPITEVSRFIDHCVGAFFLAKAFRLYEQKASDVLVIVAP
jgi:hypothetical protein